MKVYLSGCMTVDPNHYVEHFAEAVKTLKDLGFKDEDITNPALKEHNDRVIMACQIKDPWSKEAWKDFIKYDIDLVSQHDAIALLNGWENSNGAYVELATAKRFGLAVMFEEDGFETIHHSWEIKDLKNLQKSLNNF